MSNIKKYLFQNKKKIIVNAILSLMVFVVSGLLLKNFAFGFIYAILLFALRNTKVTVKNATVSRIITIVGSLCLVLSTYIASLFMVSTRIKFTISFEKFLLNIVCILVVCTFIYIISARWRMSVSLGCSLLLILTVANGVVYAFRGNELSFNDFLSIKTAMSVASQYVFSVPKMMVHGVLLWSLLCTAYLSLPEMTKIGAVKSRIIAAVSEALCLSLLFFSTNGMRIETWKNYGTVKNGYFLNFFLTVKDHDMKKNDGYDFGIKHFIDVYVDKTGSHTGNDIEAIAQTKTEKKQQQHQQQPDKFKNILLHSDECKKNGCANNLICDFRLENSDNSVVDISQSKKPNIIVIMNESFSDYRVIGDGITTNIPVTPYYDSLSENTIKGYALSSVFGGNTANSEFEFLTGHSMCFMPKDSVPYQQFISGTVHTLPWYLSSLGYKTVSTHPYGKTGWSRDRLYPKLGFSESTFLEDYQDAETIRNYVKDIEVYKKIVSRMQEETTQAPLFMFAITMQNHGGYTYEGENFTKTVEIVGLEGQYPLAEQYLTLVNESDVALEYLLTELENFDEDTIVLFFGDHFPKIETEFYEAVYGNRFTTLEEQLLQYKIPFFIWANYDIEEASVDCTSINYLSSYLLETADVYQSPYYTFMAEMRQVVPFINASGYYSVSEERFIDYTQAQGDEQHWLNTYHSLQYNNLHPKERNFEIFERYIDKDKLS